MRKTIITITATLAMLPALAGATYATLPACPTEDSHNCVWDASERGNGHGRDFVTVADVTIIFGGLS